MLDRDNVLWSTRRNVSLPRLWAELQTCSSFVTLKCAYPKNWQHLQALQRNRDKWDGSEVKVLPAKMRPEFDAQ